MLKRLKRIFFPKSEEQQDANVCTAAAVATFSEIYNEIPSFIVERDPSGNYSFKAPMSVVKDGDTETSVKVLDTQPTDADDSTIRDNSKVSTMVNDCTTRNFSTSAENTYQQQTDDETQQTINRVTDDSKNNEYSDVRDHTSQPQYQTLSDESDEGIDRVITTADEQPNADLYNNYMYTEGECMLRAHGMRNQQTVRPMATAYDATTSSTQSGNHSDINLIETDDLEYKRLNIIVMTKLQDRSTAAVAVDVVALIGYKLEETDKEPQGYTNHGFKVEQVNACMAKYHMGNFRADVSFQWMDNAVINGRTSFETSTDSLYRGLVWEVKFRVKSSVTFNKDVGFDSSFQCEICIQQENCPPCPVIIMMDLHESSTTDMSDLPCRLRHCLCKRLNGQATVTDTSRETFPSAAQRHPAIFRLQVSEPQVKKQLYLNHTQESSDFDDKCKLSDFDDKCKSSDFDDKCNAMSEPHHVDGVRFYSTNSSASAESELVDGFHLQVSEPQVKKQLYLNHTHESSDFDDKCNAMTERHHVDGVGFYSTNSSTSAESKLVDGSRTELCRICFKTRLVQNQMRHLPSTDI